jgi:4-alpha-glucanotransferase
VQIDDVTRSAAQANVPGTPDRAPNWRRKLPVTLEDLRKDEKLRELGEELSAARQAHARPAG